MLVLSRKSSEGIVVSIGGQVVKLIVVEVRGDKCRLGFDAPHEVQIDRREIHDAKEREKKRLPKSA